MQFELVYLVVIVLGLVQTPLQWNQMSAGPGIAAMIAQFGTTPLIVTAFVLVVIQLLLWYFVARRGSVVAKWIYVVLTAYVVISGVFELRNTALLATTVGIIGAALVVLQAVAIFLLFRPDARAWFGNGDATA